MQPSAPSTTSSQALGNLQNFQSQMKQPTDFLNQQQQQLGVPGQEQQVSGLRQAITNTTNLLNQVAPSVYGRTGNSLVTDAQATRQIGNEQAPIATQLNQQNQSYTGAQSDLDRALQQAAQNATFQEQGQQQQLGNLQTVYGNLYKQEQDALANQLAQEQLAVQRSAAANSGFNFGSNGTSSNSNSAGSGLTAQEQEAANNVATFLKQGDTAALSDFGATLASAQRGNAQDKLKLQAYTTLRPDLFSSTGTFFKQPLQTASNKPGMQFLQTLPQILTPPGVSIGKGIGSLVKRYF